MSVINLKHFLLLETIVLAIANTETVQLTNSEQNLHSSHTNNFTTYQLKVPGSQPITIIEDVIQPSELSDNSSENDNRYGEKKSLIRRNGDHFTEKELISLSPSAEQRLNNRNHDVRATLSFQISDPDQPQDDDHRSDDMKKVAYPPSLLKKFIKDYSEKIKNADESTKNALKEIERLNKKHTNDGEEVTTDRMDFASDDEIEQKYNSWNDRYSHKHQSQTNPYNDKDGWVTLEAVPWSSSKVSKWHPHSSKFSNKNSYDSPLSHQPSYDDDDGDKYHQAIPRPRPQPSHYHDEFNDDYIDDHPKIKPVYTSYDPYRPQVTNNSPQSSYDTYRPSSTNNRPQSSWSQNQNTGYENRPTYKPRPRPQYDYSQSNSNNQHQSYDDDRHELNEHWYDGDRNTPKPWSQDIITDNRPSDFPIRTPSKRPYSSDRDPGAYRPFSHPENGDGEWVLVSTTKGYQKPTRHGQRAMVLSNVKPNDLLAHHSVKLTVLPSKNSSFSQDSKPMALSHGGMLEVESSFESVEDSVALANSGSKPFVKKRKIFRGIPIKKGITSDDGSGTAMLAAVGAGMVPATMAMLMPMVLGRRKRSVDHSFSPDGIVLRDFK